MNNPKYEVDYEAALKWANNTYSETADLADTLAKLGGDRKVREKLDELETAISQFRMAVREAQKAEAD